MDKEEEIKKFRSDFIYKIKDELLEYAIKRVKMKENINGLQATLDVLAVLVSGTIMDWVDDVFPDYKLKLLEHFNVVTAYMLKDVIKYNLEKEKDKEKNKEKSIK